MRNPRRAVRRVGVMACQHLHRLRRVLGARRGIQIPHGPIGRLAEEAHLDGASVPARPHSHVPRRLPVEAHSVRARDLLGDRLRAFAQ